MVVDECMWGHVATSQDEGWRTIRESLQGKRAASNENQKLHVGGTYWQEKIKDATQFQRFVLALSGAARVVTVDKAKVDVAEEKWKAVTNLNCDTDHWALGLAEIAPTKLLVSNDEGLKKDFRERLRGGTICRGRINNARQTTRMLRSFR